MADVGGLVDRFFVARDMMAQATRGGGMPAFPGMPGALGKKSKGRQPKAGRPKGKQSRSGNPAKRAAEQAAAVAQQQARREEAAPGVLPPAFGGGAGAGDPDFQLPEELKGLLGPGGR